MHMYAHCTCMCEPVNAKVVKITFIGESRVMIYGSCVKLHDFFDGQDHEKASHKIFFQQNFGRFFFQLYRLLSDSSCRRRRKTRTYSESALKAVS